MKGAAWQLIDFNKPGTAQVGARENPKKSCSTKNLTLTLYIERKLCEVLGKN